MASLIQREWNTNQGRVGDRLAPIPPHQTVRSLFTNTAFRCSSSRSKHLNPFCCSWYFVKPVFIVEFPSREQIKSSIIISDFVTLAQMYLHPLLASSVLLLLIWKKGERTNAFHGYISAKIACNMNVVLAICMKILYIWYHDWQNSWNHTQRTLNKIPCCYGYRSAAKR